MRTFATSRAPGPRSRLRRKDAGQPKLRSAQPHPRAQTFFRRVGLILCLEVFPVDDKQNMIRKQVFKSSGNDENPQNH